MGDVLQGAPTELGKIEMCVKKCVRVYNAPVSSRHVRELGLLEIVQLLPLLD